MDNEETTAILAIDDALAPSLSVGEAQEFQAILKQFVESYLKHRESMPVEAWLHDEMAESLPASSEEEISQMCGEIMTTLHMQDEKKKSLDAAVANGRSKESWFASDMKTATSHMSTQEASRYLQGLDDALANANDSLYRTIHTQSGAISQNPHLDGFIAEQYHAQTFNLNAEATGSPYRAKVLEPTGHGYSKNSVDIVIVDENGKVVRRYQSKYYKDADATAQAFERGDYRGQRKLVPKDQEQDIPQKTTTVIEAPDGTTSKPLSKKKAKELQKEAQSGQWNDLNWNEYQIKDLAIGIGKQAGQAALLGVAVGVGTDIAQKVWNDEEIDGEELVETALTSGADFGIKAATAGAIKVGVEKEILTTIPKGTPASTIANIAHIAVEDVKVVGKMATGELTFREGVEQIEQTTVAAVAGVTASAEGVAIGATIGTVFGPVGAVVGGFIGGSIGYMAGSEVGRTAVKIAQEARAEAAEAISEFGNKLADTVSSAADFISDCVGSLFSFF